MDISNTIIALVSLVLFALTSQAHAEGASEDRRCTISQTCDLAGDCVSADVEFAFTLEPVEVGPHGEGEYRIIYGSTDTKALARSDFTLIWAEARDDIQLLVSTGENTALRILRNFSTEASGQIQFLTCEDPT